ncbi:MAG: hypothetical protein KC621_19830, partial [Myxococcales bacterium]|nr:hypothetical protein [Myxococcales bacterium]
MGNGSPVTGSAVSFGGGGLLEVWTVGRGTGATIPLAGVWDRREARARRRAWSSATLGRRDVVASSGSSAGVSVGVALRLVMTGGGGEGSARSDGDVSGGVEAVRVGLRAGPPGARSVSGGNEGG